MPELSTEQRDRLRDNDFAYIDPEGGRHLPIHDREHVRNAIARFGQTEFVRQSAKYSAARRIVAAAKRHDIEVDDQSEVMRAARS
jgi:hypothetical protein